MAVARAYLALSGDLALRAADIVSAIPVNDNSKDRAQEMEEAGVRVAAILKPWKDES